MSFGQPPSRTPYGDQDFVKEDWNTQQPPSDFSQPSGQPQQPPAAYTNRPMTASQGVPYSSLVPPQPQSSYNLQQARQGNLRQPPGQTTSPPAFLTLTPEDQLFMTSWRRDSFYNRVLPLFALSNGALYYYNQSRSLPHKVSRYLLASFGAYMLGKWSYKGELKRRLETSPSNTPFMKSLRDLMGVKHLASEFSPGDQDYSGFGSSNMTSTQMSTYDGYGRMNQPSSGYRTPNQLPYNDQPNESDLSFTPPNDGTTKPMTTYEELRARNRGSGQR